MKFFYVTEEGQKWESFVSSGKSCSQKAGGGSYDNIPKVL